MLEDKEGKRTKLTSIQSEITNQLDGEDWRVNRYKLPKILQYIT